ncbi:very short patch repair endonuclease [Bradyrhizobium diazoefficiens]|nr:very short patch repair endonuclease [Bradyrhizobium diazoefficiens]WLA78135.1 very short patch repair endonuclease [Bradyrhizobium diazoefficiens]
MQSVKGKDTTPEMLVRRLVFKAGYRYRLHQKKLPGSPDLVFPARRKVIFVNGCFWHGHGCPKGKLPKSRPDFWGPKIARNKQRDADALERLRNLGWKVLTIWQCETKDSVSLRRTLVKFLGR